MLEARCAGQRCLLLWVITWVSKWSGANSFPHRDSLPALIRHLCDWRPKFSACQLIWSHCYGSNLIWWERAGFCQYGWDKAAAFTKSLNKLGREGPVSWQWSPSQSLSLPIMSLYTSLLHPHAKKWFRQRRKKKYEECCANCWVLYSMCIQIMENSLTTTIFQHDDVLTVFSRQSNL